MIKPIDIGIARGDGRINRAHNDADDGAPVSVYRVEDSAGKLSHLLVTNAGENAAFVQIHDSATTPEDGAVPPIKFKLPAGEGVCAALDTPFLFTEGCVVVLSDELATYVPSEETAHFYAINTKR